MQSKSSQGGNLAAPKVSQPKIERLWLIDDVHLYTGIPISTLKLYIATDQIPSIKIGRHRRFDPNEIKKWILRKST